jgi:hypothetical protein
VSVKLFGLIGAPYGSIFEVDGKKLVQLECNELYEDILMQDGGCPHSLAPLAVSAHNWVCHVTSMSQVRLMEWRMWTIAASLIPTQLRS